MVMDKERRAIYVWKAIAILSVVSAHVAGVNQNDPDLLKACAKVLESWGTFGVPAFLITAGFFYEGSLHRHDLKYILSNKLKGLGIPWLVCGSIVWGYVVIRKGGASFGGWFQFIVGNTSYLYYMTVLTILYLIYSIIHKREIFVYIGFSVWIINYVMGTIKGFRTDISPYLNVITWSGWFFLGTVIQKKKLQTKILYVTRKTWILCGTFVFGYIFLLCSKLQALSYWDILYPLIEIALLFAICYITSLVSKKINEESIITKIGKNSFSIYLLHMPVAGITANLMNRFYVGRYIYFFRPIIVLVITYLMIAVGEKIAYIVKMQNVYCVAIGKR